MTMIHPRAVPRVRQSRAANREAIKQGRCAEEVIFVRIGARVSSPPWKGGQENSDGVGATSQAAML